MTGSFVVFRSLSHIFFLTSSQFSWASQVALVVKNLPVNAGDAGDAGSIPKVGKIPWKRTWQPTLFLARKTPWTEEPGGLQSMGLQRVGHD